MDIVTQALLGSAVAVSGARQSEIKQAAWIGAAAGILADADALIRSSDDPLLTLEFHRHFSHALIFIPVGALIAASLIWLGYRFLSKSSLAFRRIYYYSFLGYLLSGVLDAFTSYGTHLFWPFSEERVAWSLVSIVDPIFSGMLLLGLIVAIKTRHIRSVRISLSLCGLYLAFSYFQSSVANDALVKLASARGHELERYVIKPTFGNVFLWRTVYLNNNMYFIDAVHTLLDNKVYEGVSIPALNVANDFQNLDKNSLLYKDILRFNNFSNEYIVAAPNRSNTIGDIRYSMLPVSANPLWGIEINPELPDTHAQFVTIRENFAEKRGLFINMLLGQHKSE